MASPITLYIIPNCGLQIDFDVNQVSEHNSNPIEYIITKKSDELSLRSDHVGVDEVFSGTMAPVHETTLPKAIKTKAGIPESATYFSFLHPPANLAAAVDWEEWEFNNAKNLEKIENEYNEKYIKMEDVQYNESESNHWAMPTVGLIGAYVYFNSNFDVLSVNVLSLRPTKFDLRFSGPFQATEEAEKSIRRSHRAQPLVIDHFHEVGFVASACIRPNEMFELKSPIKEITGQEIKVCSHGGFLFLRDDGSSVIYVIENAGYVDYEGDVSSLADAFQQKQRRICKNSDLGFTTNFEFEEDMTKMKNDIETKERNKLLKSLDDRKTLLHRAFKTGCSSEVIKNLLEEECDNLLHPDSTYKWTPLMYACRFMIKEEPLILDMIKRCPESVVVRDKYLRTALHIACEHDQVSVKILRALLEAENGSSCLFQATKNLGRLPIHIA